MILLKIYSKKERMINMKKILSITLALIMILGVMAAGVPTITAGAAGGAASVSLKSTAYNSNATVTIGWQKGSGGATGFQIAKIKLGDKKYSYINVGGGNTKSYNDKSIFSGTIYYYQVRSVYKSGKTKTYGAWSNTKSITTLYRPTVTGFTHFENEPLIIDWNRIKGVSHYKLAFKRSTDKAWNFRDVKSTSYNVQNPTRGARYYVQVCAMNGKIAGQWSAVNKKMIGSNIYKPTITSVDIADNEDDCIQINWTFPIKCEGCEIYVKKATDDGWSSSRHYRDGFGFDGDGSEELDMYLWGIEPGNTYYFQVRAIMDDFINFAFSNFSNVYSFYVPDVQAS